MNYAKQGNTSGIINRNLKIEAIKIEGKNLPENVTIEYQSHVQDLGWEKDWKTEGKQSGTTGQNKKIEAVRIKLNGTSEYSIIYRTYIQGRGWQDWANDGEISGTTGKNLKVEAIELKIVPKIKNVIRTYVDTPVSANIEQGNLKVSGWVMTDIENIKIQMLIDNEVIKTTTTKTARNDVIEAIKGYGGDEKNPKPGFQIETDLNNINLGNRNIKIQFIDSKGKVLKTEEYNTKVHNKIEYSEGIYGKTGLKESNQGGSDLNYYKYGNGENVFFATFAIHGFEDKWSKDGKELVDIANQFYQKLINDKDFEIAEKWTIYIFPGVNKDGLKNGWTNNGPGRTTLYSKAPNNKGIDLNRCWQIGSSYQKYSDDRNYNGTQGFQAYEAEYLKRFLNNNKSQKGQTILVDLHGWTQQLIGDEGICSYYRQQFSENNGSAIGRYGTGYLINWARSYLGSNGKPARSALIELPNNGVNNHQDVLNKNFGNRYINATLSMLKSI